MQTVEYNIDRKSASKLLKVSVRTVDRYLKSKKLSSRVVDGRVWLSKDEIEGYMHRQHRGLKVDTTAVSMSNLSSDKTVDKDDNSPDKVDILESETRKKSSGRKSSAYKKLYEELQVEIKEKQGRLEVANYRVGQLENQLRNSIPLLQYHRESQEKKAKELKYKKEITQKDSLLQSLKKELRNEQLVKKVFAFLCFLIMALQPLWLLMFLD